MSSRTNKESVPPEQDFSKEVPSSRDVAVCTENFTSGIGQAPVFNIHIHVPPSNETNATTMYLPKILPILHVHFDELAKKLQNNVSHENKVFSEKYFENLVKQITPKLGNVLFHQETNSNERHFNKNEVNILYQKQSLREKNSSIEFKGCGSDQTVTMNEHYCANVSDCSERTRGIGSDGLPRVLIQNGRPVRLKKAVVVLEDICKSKSYKSGRIRTSLNCQESESSSNSLSFPLNELSNFGSQIKTEPDMSFHENPTLDEKASTNNDNSYVNSFTCPNFSDSANEFNKERCRKKEILESLVEGCNFHEILEKFRQRYGKDSALKLEKLLSKSQTTGSDNGSTVIENDKSTIVGKFEPTEDSVQTQQEAVGIVQSNDVDDQQQGDLNSHTDEPGELHSHTDELGDLNTHTEGLGDLSTHTEGLGEPNTHTDGLDSKDGIPSYETENQPSQNSYEIDTKCDVEMSKSSNFVSSSIDIVKNEVDQMHESNGKEYSINPYHVYEFTSDDYENTTKNKLSSDDVGNLETLEFESSNCMSNKDIKSEFASVVTNDLILNDVGDEYFDLNSVKKEVVSPEKDSSEMARYKKRNSKDDFEDESSPKKIRQSLEREERSAKKSSRGEDYISLSVPGPTKFAVVPLSNVKAYEGHDAKNFKKDMLFGNRVNRFSNPDHLRIYKLKKQAAKTRSK